MADHRGHAGPAVVPGHFDAVDIGLPHVVELSDRFLDLGGRDVLALPSEGVADAVDEIEIAVLILAHQVAGAEPDVALLEHVAQDLTVALVLAGIALESLPGGFEDLQDLADDLARLVGPAFDAKTTLVADRLLALHIEADDLGGEAAGNPPRQPADGAFLALEIEQRNIAFGRGVELDDLRDLEAPLEFRPDIGAQPVAAGEAKMMRALVRTVAAN